MSINVATRANRVIVLTINKCCQLDLAVEREKDDPIRDAVAKAMAFITQIVNEARGEDNRYLSIVVRRTSPAEQITGRSDEAFYVTYRNSSNNRILHFRFNGTDPAENDEATLIGLARTAFAKHAPIFTKELSRYRDQMPSYIAQYGKRQIKR